MARWLLVFIGIALCIENSSAQTYPGKPVRLIVAYPPGGSSDLMSRVFGAKLSEMWGQQVIVESKPGAAGSIGTEYAARQAPDGYTFMVGNLGPVAVNPLLSKVPYNVERDFIAVSLISTGPNVLVVHADSPFRSLNDIIAFAKANPGKLNYGTSGPGSVSHLSSEMLKNITKVQAVEVPYKGGVLAVQPICQAAAPGLVAVNWWGVLLPAGTPREIAQKLNADTVKALQDADVKKKFADLGVEAVSSTPEQFSAFIRAETEKYA